MLRFILLTGLVFGCTPQELPEVKAVVSKKMIPDVEGTPEPLPLPALLDCKGQSDSRVRYESSTPGQGVYCQSVSETEITACDGSTGKWKWVSKNSYQSETCAESINNYCDSRSPDGACISPSLVPQRDTYWKNGFLHRASFLGAALIDYDLGEDLSLLKKREVYIENGERVNDSRGYSELFYDRDGLLSAYDKKGVKVYDRPVVAPAVPDVITYENRWAYRDARNTNIDGDCQSYKEFQTRICTNGVCGAWGGAYTYTSCEEAVSWDSKWTFSSETDCTPVRAVRAWWADGSHSGWIDERSRYCHGEGNGSNDTISADAELLGYCPESRNAPEFPTLHLGSAFYGNEYPNPCSGSNPASSLSGLPVAGTLSSPGVYFTALHRTDGPAWVRNRGDGTPWIVGYYEKGLLNTPTKSLKKRIVGPLEELVAFDYDSVPLIPALAYYNAGGAKYLFEFRKEGKLHSFTEQFEQDWADNAVKMDWDNKPYPSLCDDAESNCTFPYSNKAINLDYLLTGFFPAKILYRSSGDAAEIQYWKEGEKFDVLGFGYRVSYCYNNFMEQRYGINENSVYRNSECLPDDSIFDITRSDDRYNNRWYQGVLRTFFSQPNKTLKLPSTISYHWTDGFYGDGTPFTAQSLWIGHKNFTGSLRTIFYKQRAPRDLGEQRRCEEAVEVSTDCIDGVCGEWAAVDGRNIGSFVASIQSQFGGIKYLNAHFIDTDEDGLLGTEDYSYSHDCRDKWATDNFGEGDRIFPEFEVFTDKKEDGGYLLAYSNRFDLGWILKRLSGEINRQFFLFSIEGYKTFFRSDIRYCITEEICDSEYYVVLSQYYGP